MSRRDDARDRGATLVEFAFVAPILFFLLVVMLDIGLVVIGKSVASGAARDGARVGIIHFENADNTASPNFALVKTAVEAKVVGLISPASANYVKVKCLDGASKATKPCTRSSIIIDRDLIEVTVDWSSVSASNGVIIPTGHSDKARMVIIGDGVGGPITPPCAGSGQMEFASASATTAETDADTTVNLTVTRSNTVCTSSVTYTTSNGPNPSATAGTDYEAQVNVLTFGPGDATVSVPIVIKGDDVAEPTENFRVTLSAPTGGSLGGTTQTTVAITDDDASAPVLVSLQMFDNDTDGLVDQVVATFDQPVTGNGCANSVTLTNVPSGGTRGGVTVGGSAVTIAVNEGGGAKNTAVGGFTVQLSAGCVTSTSGSLPASFPATAPDDEAGPVIVSTTDSGGVDGKAEQNDVLTYTFSENVVGAPASTAVTLTASTITINGVLVQSNLNPKNNGDYATGTVVFNNSQVTSSGATITITLGAPSGGTAIAGQSNSTGPTFSPSGSIKDAAGNGAGGSYSIPANNYKYF